MLREDNLIIQEMAEDEVEGDEGRKRGKKKKGGKKASLIDVGEVEEEPPAVDTTVDKPEPVGESKEEG